jgi:hypothetical protein
MGCMWDSGGVKVNLLFQLQITSYLRPSMAQLYVTTYYMILMHYYKLNTIFLWFDIHIENSLLYNTKIINLAEFRCPTLQLVICHFVYGEKCQGQLQWHEFFFLEICYLNIQYSCLGWKTLPFKPCTHIDV